MIDANVPFIIKHGMIGNINASVSTGYLSNISNMILTVTYLAELFIDPYESS